MPFVGIRQSDGRLYRIGKIALSTTAVPIGEDAIAGGKDTTAIGSGSLTTGDTTVAVGDNSVATGKDTVAVGTSSLATGKGTIASGSNSVATGRDTISSGSNSLTAGSGSKADAENSVAFGKGTIASKEEQVVIGRYNTADTQSLFVVGAGTDDTNRKTIMKVDTEGARVDGTFTISGSSTFTNIGPAVFSGSIAQESNTATGTRAVALGYQSEASGLYSVAYGNQTTALGNYSFAGGTNTIASGTYSVALGAYTYAAQNASLAFGGFSRTNGLYSIAAGLRVTSSGNYQVVVGKDNIELSDTAAFIVGNGTNNDIRGNLLVASGDIVQITGSLQVTAGITGSLLGTAATASYVLNAVSSSFASTSSLSTVTNTVNTVGTNAGGTNHIVFTNIASTNANTLYTDAGGGLTFNPGTNTLTTTAISATSITGSLSGTATTASYVNNLVQNVIVTGSVTATSFTGSLRGHVVTSSINTANYLLLNSSGNTVYNWESNALSDGYQTSVDVSNRTLIDQYGRTALSYYNNRSNIGDDGIEVQGNVSTRLSDLVGWCDDSHSFDAGEYHDRIYPFYDTYAYGTLLYLDYTTQKWIAVDQTSDVCSRYLGIAIDDKITLSEGHFEVTDIADPMGSLPQITEPLLGMPVYIIEGSNGHPNNSFSCTIPGSGIVRVVGHIVARGDTKPSNYIIKFKPSNDWYEI